MPADKTTPALRTDVWVDAFDGAYRLFLDMPHICEIERKCGFVDRNGDRQPCGLFAVYGRVAKGRYDLDGKQVGFAVEGEATITDCLETVRLALTGGGMAVVNGELVKVSPQRANELIDAYLKLGPVEEAWNLAFLILHAAIHGRPARENEIGVSIRQPVPPEQSAPAADS